jgi:hypothetical protein
MTHYTAKTFAPNAHPSLQAWPLDVLRTLNASSSMPARLNRLRGGSVFDGLTLPLAALALAACGGGSSPGVTMPHPLGDDDSETPNTPDTPDDNPDATPIEKPGTDGSDTFTATLPRENFNGGGGGSDTVSYADSTAGVTADLATGSGAGRNALFGGSGNDVFILDNTNNVTGDTNRASIIVDFAATNAETDSIKLTGTIDTIWIDQSASVGTGSSSDLFNDATISDTVIYTNAAKTEILVVLEDFTGDLTGLVTNDVGAEVTIL